MAGTSDPTTIVPVRIVDLDRRYETYRLRGHAARESALSNSLERDGQRAPVLVSDGVEPGRLVLLDGFKRVDLLRQREQESVLAVVLSIDEPSSLATILAANAAQPGTSDLEEAWVLRALHEEHGKSQVEIAALVGRDKSWVCRRLRLATHLDRQVQDDIRVGLLSPTIGRELAVLPRGNQARVAESIVRHRLSSRQARELIKVVRAAPQGDRERVLADPLSHLPLRQSPHPFPDDKRLSDAANRVRSQLLVMHSSANRIHEAFLNRPPGSFEERDTTVLGELAPPILRTIRDVLETVEEAITIPVGSEP